MRMDLGTQCQSHAIETVLREKIFRSVWRKWIITWSRTKAEHWSFYSPQSPRHTGQHLFICANNSWWVAARYVGRNKVQQSWPQSRPSSDPLRQRISHQRRVGWLSATYCRRPTLIITQPIRDLAQIAKFKKRSPYKSTHILLFPVDRYTHEFFSCPQSNLFDVTSLFQNNHVVHWNAPREGIFLCGVITFRITQCSFTTCLSSRGKLTVLFVRHRSVNCNARTTCTNSSGVKPDLG